MKQFRGNVPQIGLCPQFLNCILYPMIGIFLFPRTRSNPVMFEKAAEWMRKNFHMLLIGAVALALLHYRYGKSSFALPVQGRINACSGGSGKSSLTINPATGADSYASQPQEGDMCYASEEPIGKIVGGKSLRPAYGGRERYATREYFRNGEPEEAGQEAEQEAERDIERAGDVGELEDAEKLQRLDYVF